MTSKAVRGGYVPLPTQPVITICSRHSLGPVWRMTGGTLPASGGNPFSANEMLAYPIRLTAPVTNVNKVFWVNGASTGNNVSVGLYDADFKLLKETASTAMSGALPSAPQTIAFATKLGPGLYYLALAHDSGTTGRFFRWTLATTGNQILKMMGCWKQASITLGALPATATPAAVTNVGWPVHGLINRTTFDV